MSSWNQFCAYLLAASPILIGLGLAGSVWFGYRRGFSEGMDGFLNLMDRTLDTAEKNAVEPIIPGGVIQQILEANVTRHFANFHRRTIKLMEELGELSEAYLNVTSAGNGKGLSYADIREEAADCVIVAVDLALTPTPDQEELTTEQVTQAMADMIAKKLAKWRKNRDTGRSATDAE